MRPAPSTRLAARRPPLPIASPTAPVTALLCLRRSPGRSPRAFETGCKRLTRAVANDDKPGASHSAPPEDIVKRRDWVLRGSALLAAGLCAPLRAQPSLVKFGQSASLSGGQADYGRDVRDGIL